MLKTKLQPRTVENSPSSRSMENLDRPSIEVESPQKSKQRQHQQRQQQQRQQPTRQRHENNNDVVLTREQKEQRRRSSAEVPDQERKRENRRSLQQSHESPIRSTPGRGDIIDESRGKRRSRTKDEIPSGTVLEATINPLLYEVWHFNLQLEFSGITQRAINL